MPVAQRIVHFGRIFLLAAWTVLFAGAAHADNEWNSIPLPDISGQPLFIPFVFQGTNMELIVIHKTDGSIRAAYNTCQICQGSPYAFFKLTGSMLECQNCGNSFELDSIGKNKQSCNPIAVMDARKQNGGLLISSEELKKLVPAFKNWKQGI